MSDGAVIISTKIDDAAYRRGLMEMQRAGQNFAKSAANDFSTVSEATEALNVSLLSAAKGMIAFVASYKGLQAVSAALDLGVNYNKQIESARLGIASIVSSTMNLVDANGKVLEGQEKFLAAQKLSVEMADALDAASYKSTADYTNLLSAFQSVLGAGAARGLDWQDSLDIVVKMSNVLQSMGYSMEFLDYETRRIVSGFDMANSRVGKQLGISAETIQSWGQGSEYLKNFNKHFGTFAYTGEAAANTLAAVTSLLNDSLETLAGELTKNYFDSYRDSLRTVADAFTELDEAANKTVIAEDMRDLVQLGQDMVTVFGEIRLAAAEGFVDALRDMSKWVGENRKSINAFGDVLAFFGSNLDKIVAAYAAWNIANRIFPEKIRKNIDAQIKENAALSTGRAVKIQSAKADIMKARAAQEAAQAELAAANAAQARAQQDLAAARAAQVSAVSRRQVRQAASEEIVALRALAQADNAVMAAQGQLAASTATLTAAQKKARLHTRAWAARSNLINMAKIKAGFTSLITLMGGPFMAAFTAGGAAVYALRSRIKDAARESQRLRDALKDVNEEIDATNKEAATQQEILARVGVENARRQVEQEQAALQNYIRQLGDANEVLKSIRTFSEVFFWGNNEDTQAALDIFKQYRAGLLDIGAAYEQVQKLREKYDKSAPVEKMLGIMEAILGGETLITKALKEEEAAQKKLEEATKRRITVANGAVELTGKQKTAVEGLEREIRRLTRTRPESFAEKLADAEEKIKNGAEEAKLPLSELNRLLGLLRTGMEELQKASQQDFLKGLDAKIADMSGDLRALNDIKFEREWTGIKEQMEDLKIDAKTIDDYKNKFETAWNAKIEIQNLQDAVNFLKEMESLSGQYGISTETQNKLIEAQGAIYRDRLGPMLAEYGVDVEELTEKWKELEKLQNSREWGDGFKRSARDWISEWTDAAKIAEKQFQTLTDFVDNLGSSVVDSLFDGAEFRVDKLFEEIAKQLIKIQITSAIAGVAGIFKPTAHRGGVAGVAMTGSKRVDPAVFAAAPRYHSGGIAGLSYNEIPAILQRGEGVFTKAQMKALGAGLSAVPEVQVNFIDQTTKGTDVKMQQTPTANGGLRLDLTIIDVVNGNISAGGKIDRTIRNKYGLNVRPNGR